MENKEEKKKRGGREIQKIWKIREGGWKASLESNWTIWVSKYSYSFHANMTNARE